MFFLILLGINITASVVTWYNGKRSAEVEEQIAELESQWEEICSADAQARRQLVFGYIKAFRNFLEAELVARKEIGLALANALEQALQVMRNRFGSVEHDSFMQAARDIEFAMARVNAEQAYLATLCGLLEGDIDDVDLDAALPVPDDLELPMDFPVLGGIIEFTRHADDAFWIKMPGYSQERTDSIHGYTLTYKDKPVVQNGDDEQTRNVTVVAVDHEKRTATLSSGLVPIMLASLGDGVETLVTRVVSSSGGRTELEYEGRRFRLQDGETRQHRAFPIGQELKVYPGIWLLRDLLAESSSKPLPVRLNPRIIATRSVWSPVHLAVSEARLGLLVDAHAALEEQGRTHEKWDFCALPEGKIAIAQGDIALIVSADLEQHAFVLHSVRYDFAGDISAPVSLYAELNAFVPGTDDDCIDQRSQFLPFMNALQAELRRTGSMYLQRRTALRLRKLSMIYQDQVAHLQSQNSCGFLVGSFKGDRIEGLLPLEQLPAWLGNAIDSGESSRLVGVGRGHSWKIAHAEWIDRKMGLLRLVLRDPRRRGGEISPAQISRLQLMGDGAQQQTFHRTLEAAIEGKFVSEMVHGALTGGQIKPAPHQHEGRAAVHALLASEQPVVAIWGPPGTGKTTLLVDWLLSYFVTENKAQWPTVLITGPTHVAVTKLMKDLLIRADFLYEESVRYGQAGNLAGSGLDAIWHEQLLAPFIPETFIDEIPAQDEANSAVDAAGIDILLQRWKGLLGTSEGRRSIANWIFGGRHIHGATCVGMARRDFALTSREFDIVVIDEAGKAFEVEVLIPASRAKRLVLVGDHSQLPPTVTDEFLSEDIDYRLPLAEVEDILRTNCFENLFNRLPAESKGMLTTQYRMHRHIGDLVSKMFYEGKLSSARQERDWRLSTHRVMFIDFTAMMRYRHLPGKKGSSLQNTFEREALELLIQRLQQIGSARGKSIMVICPYKGQRESVDAALRARAFDFDCTVTTVDAVQGGEADIVFLLMTRHGGRVHFLLDRNRINVALSRARDAVYILGHRGALSPGGQGPIAEMIKHGLEQQVLRVVSVREGMSLPELARTVFIGETLQEPVSIPSSC